MVRTAFVAAIGLLLLGCGGDDAPGAGPGAGQAATTGADVGPGGAGSGASASHGAGPGPGTSASGSGSGPGGASTTGSGPTTSTGATGGGAPGVGIASHYPGDVGIDQDPAVVWAENFEEGSVSSVVARYDDHKNDAGMALLPDVPAKSGGQASMQWIAGGSGPTATDVFKQLPDHDELWTRWYAKYEAGVTWHHTGVWLGGYDPPETYPNPQAGLRPNGDDRFSVSIEPAFDIGGPSPRLDFYNYWMTMHSWIDQPMGSTAYYGNALVHQLGFTLDEGQSICIEVHVRLNDDPTSAAGGVLEVWKDDVLLQHFDDAGAVGYWIKDKFCPEGADAPECTDYPPPAGTQLVPLDLQWRSAASLHLNAFWPQNYVTDGPAGAVQFDDMVVATARIGCLQ